MAVKQGKAIIGKETIGHQSADFYDYSRSTNDNENCVIKNKEHCNHQDNQKLLQLALFSNYKKLNEILLHELSNKIAGVLSLSEIYCENPERIDPSGIKLINRSTQETVKIIESLRNLNNEGANAYVNINSFIEDNYTLFKKILPAHTNISLMLEKKEIIVSTNATLLQHALTSLFFNLNNFLAQNDEVLIKTNENNSVVSVEVSIKAEAANTLSHEISSKRAIGPTKLITEAIGGEIIESTSNSLITFCVQVPKKT